MKIQGIDVKDANEEIEVTITPRDIQLGKKKSSHECAAARALCREHQAEAAIVHFSRAYIKKDGTWWRYGVPAMLRSEVVAFDRGGQFAAADGPARRSDQEEDRQKDRHEAAERQAPKEALPRRDGRPQPHGSGLGVI